ncbi:MAG: hypothetical protein WCA22_06280 [Candidatus Binatus sp.]
MVAEKVERHHREKNENARNQNPRVTREILYVLRLRQQVAQLAAGS